jgi:hypothetical protein
MSSILGNNIVVKLRDTSHVFDGENRVTDDIIVHDNKSNETVVVDFANNAEELFLKRIDKSEGHGILGVRIVRAIKNISDKTGKQFKLYADAEYWKNFDFFDNIQDFRTGKTGFLVYTPQKIIIKSFPNHRGRPGKVGGSVARSSNIIVKKGGEGSGYHNHPGGHIGPSGELERGGSRSESAQTTSTSEFKKWFGDSKVVNADGTPKVLYHGTASDFTEFDRNKLGGRSDNPSHELGFYFAEDPEIASEFAFGEGGNVMPVFLKMENPYYMDAKDFAEDLSFWRGMRGGTKFSNDDYWRSIGHYEELRNYLVKNGHDGLIIVGKGYKEYIAANKPLDMYPELYKDNYIVWNPEQIKSATGNIGTFDPDNPDITKSVFKELMEHIGIVEKQLPIDDASKSNLIKIRISMFNDIADDLAEKVFIGEMTVGSWEEAMKKSIRELHTSVAAIARGGWDNMSWADWGRLGNPLKAQYQYLHNFAQAIVDRKDTISIEAIKARSHMYGEASGGSASLIEAGHVLEDLLPWLPRDGSTRCLTNCCCKWELEIIDKVGEFYVLQCTWRLGPVEHCDDCKERDGFVKIIRVHESVDVPDKIGGWCD